ncbi:MAG: glycosyltransferase [Clostridia bacterium]|nr:glycosyltransferase [Clostridia bacterium]
MKISVCIPMYNENRIIAQSARTLSDYMAANFEDYEIIFSNDGSQDGCDKTVEALNLPCVRVIGDSVNRGKGYAVRQAILNATGDVRIFTDADLAYGTEVIGRIAELFEQNPDHDIIIGSRNLQKDGYEGYTFIRKLASKIYIRVLCIAGGFRLSDSQCGCKAFRASAAEKIFPRCEINRFAFDFEAILWALKLKLSILEMPVKIINHGESNVRIVRDSIRMIRDLRKMKKRIKKAKIEE